MLSLQNIRSAEAARSYFSKDNYYSKDTFRAEYFGEGARSLSLLEKEVTQSRFMELLNGQMAEGEHTPKHKNHRPGYDLTFSAPKSVSISALAIDDKQLNTDMIEAHRAAVDHALRYIEKNLATTRTMNKKTGEKIVEESGNILAVKFEHDTSRELDPQLHTHCVVMNATLDRNGQWKALNNEEFYKNQKLVGVVYQAHLARCLSEKGYRIESQPNGMMELTGFRKEHLDHFSTRRLQIKEYMAQYGLSSSRKAEEATLKTRRAKVEIDRAELYEVWRHETGTLGIGPKTPERYAPHDPTYGAPAYADSALRYAVAKLSERNTIMKERDLLTTALTEGMGRCSVKDIEAAYSRAREKMDIITTKSRTVVTQLHLDTEKVNIAIMKQGRGAVAPVTTDHDTTGSFVAFAERKGFSLSEGQQNSARLILTTRDRIVGIEGYAGTGKTTMLELVKTEAEKQGYTVKGYCPSSAAAAVLKKETGMETATLASHLIAQQKEGRPPADGKELWIIDEASMVSTMQAFELLKAAEKQQARLVFLGDRKQLASVEAGKPFAQLIDNGMAYEKITEIRRQKNLQLREAVYESMDPKKIIDSLKKLDIEKIPDQHKRLDRMVEDYLNLPAGDRAKTLLLTSTNDDRRAINDAVRKGLQKEGTLTGPSLETTVLAATGLTKAELRKIESYHEGQVIRFGRKYKTLGVDNGDHALIVGMDRQRGMLEVETTAGRRLTLDIDRHKNLELFDTEKRDLQKGDTLRFTKNDKQQNLMNGIQATVVHLDTKTKNVTLEVQGTIRTMKADEIRYLDHAYATTVHSSQGLTCERVLVNMDTKKEMVLGQEAFYVGISRATKDARIYTDAPEKLPDALKKSLAQKSAIEEVEKDRRPPAPEKQKAQGGGPEL